MTVLYIYLLHLQFIKNLLKKIQLPMSSLFYYGDLLKSPLNFLFRGKEQLSTHLGFFFSLGLVLFLLNSIINSDFIQFNKPTISIQSDQTELYGRMSFDRKNFTIATKIADYYGFSSINLSYFYFNVSFKQYNSMTEQGYIKQTFMKICEESDFNEEDLKLNLTNKAFCIGDNESLILEGAINTAPFSFSQISLHRCDNFSAKYFNTSCKSISEINNYFNDKVLYLYYPENKFDLTNFLKPISYHLTVHMSYIYPVVQKSFVIYVQKTLIQTDRCIILKIDK